MQDGTGNVVGKSGVGIVFELSWWVVGMLVWKGGMEGGGGGFGGDGCEGFRKGERWLSCLGFWYLD